MTNNLPSIFPITADDFDQPTIDARKMHEFLGVHRDYTTWIKDRIEKYQFVENQDFTNFPQIGGKIGRGRPTSEYMLTIDTAKEIAMVENNEKGREVRRYFITCERELRAKIAAPPPPMLPAQIAEVTLKSELSIADMLGIPRHFALQEICKIASSQSGIDHSALISRAKDMSNVPYETVMLEPTELGKLLGMTARETNARLAEMGLQTREANGWIPTDKGDPLCERHAWVKGSKSGYNLKWRAKDIEDLNNA